MGATFGPGSPGRAGLAGAVDVKRGHSEIEEGLGLLALDDFQVPEGSGITLRILGRPAAPIPSPRGYRRLEGRKSESNPSDLSCV